MMPKGPSTHHARRARGTPPSETVHRPPGAARIGPPALVALVSALALLALLFCALFVPGFVRPAGAETTTTQVDPSATEPETTDTSPDTTDTLPVEPVPTEPAPGRKLVTLPWGDGEGEVGLVAPEEGLTRGPEALTVAPDGRIAILDSVNCRLVLLAADGSVTGTVAVTLSQPRFLAADDQSLYVLDADEDRQLLTLDWQGATLQEIAVPEPSDVVTGLFATTDGPCIEVAHEDVFLVDCVEEEAAAKRGGKAAKAELRATAGRPLDRDMGQAVKVTFKPKEGMKVKRLKVDKKSLEGTQTQAFTPSFGGMAVEHLVSVDGDGRGGLIVGARLLRSKSDPEDAPALIVGRLVATQGPTDSSPVLADTLTLLDSPFAYLGQPYVVAPDGRILQPVGADDGYSIYVHTLPGDTSETLAGSSALSDAEEVQS